MEDYIKDMWLNNFNSDEENNVNIAKLLYKNKIINKEILQKYSPLVFMIKNNYNLFDIKQFIKSGISFNEIDNNGYFPLFMSVIKNNLSLVKLMIKYKADVNQQFNNKNSDHIYNGKTSLHIVSYELNYPIMVELLKNKANPNILDSYGNNCINYILKHNGIHNEKRFEKRKLIELLINFNANPNVINNKNESSYFIAKKQNLKLELIEKKVKLNKIKKNLILHQGLHERLGKNSVLKNLPFDLFDKIMI